MQKRLRYALGLSMALVMMMSGPVQAAQSQTGDKAADESQDNRFIQTEESLNVNENAPLTEKESSEDVDSSESALEEIGQGDKGANEKAEIEGLVLSEINKGKIYYRSDLDIFYRGDETVTNQWVDLGGDRYFADPQGHPYRNCFINFGPKRMFYLAADGALQTGFFESPAGLHYAKKSGQDMGLLLKNNAWVKLNEGRIFPNDKGVLYRNQFISFGADKRFYMNKEGFNMPGPVKADGTVYDQDEQGMLIQKAHRYYFEGKEYFANEKGMPYRNCFITFGPKKTQLTGEDGSIQKGIVRYRGVVYRFDDKGYLVKKSSAYTFEGGKYFSDPQGMPYRNTIINFGPGKAYYMGDDGSMQTGFIKAGNKTYLANNDTGRLLIGKGLLDIDGKRYYSSDSDYALYQGWLEKDGENYYFDPDSKWPARLENTRKVIDGVSYEFDQNGISKSLNIFSEAGEWTYDGHKIFGPAISTRKVGANHTIISLDHQYMWIFNDGALAYETAVITGRPTMPTVRGNFVVQGKERNRILRGPDYESKVKYWVPFYYSYGIHDASWQRSGNFYKDSLAYRRVGSHGCVNVKPSVMRIIYPMLIRGSAVTVY